MSFPLTVNPVQGRICGGCTACCTALGIPELSKPMHTACQFEVCRHGCKIYADRPRSCRDFNCLWLQGILVGDERRRPDALGLIFATYEGKVPGMLCCWEMRPGDVERNRFLLNQIKDKVLVFIFRQGKEAPTMLGPRDLMTQAQELYDGIEEEV